MLADRLVQSGQRFSGLTFGDQTIDLRQCFGGVFRSALLVVAAPGHLGLSKYALDPFVVRVEDACRIEVRKDFFERTIAFERSFDQTVNFLTSQLTPLGVDIPVEILEHLRGAVESPRHSELPLRFVDRALFELAVDTGDHLVDGNPPPVGVDPPVDFGLGFDDDLDRVRNV